jgi:hypothetical protein
MPCDAVTGDTTTGVARAQATNNSKAAKETYFLGYGIYFG